MRITPAAQVVLVLERQSILLQSQSTFSLDRAGVLQAQEPPPKIQLFKILALFQVPAYLDHHILCISRRYLPSLPMSGLGNG